MHCARYRDVMYAAELHQLYFVWCISVWKLVRKLWAACTKWRHTLHAVLVSRWRWQRVAPSLQRRGCRSFGHTSLLFGQLNCFFRLFYLGCMKGLHYSTVKAYKFSGVRRCTTDLISVIGLKLQQPSVCQTKTHVSRSAIRLFLCLSFLLALLVPASLYFS